MNFFNFSPFYVFNVFLSFHNLSVPRFISRPY